MGTAAGRLRHSQGHIPGPSPHAPLAHWPAALHRPTHCPLAREPTGCRNPLCSFPCFPMYSGSRMPGEQRGCPCSLCMTIGPMPPRSSHTCLPQLPAAAALPALSQLSADDSRDCSTAYSDAKPRLTSCWGAHGPCGRAVGAGQTGSRGVPRVPSVPCVPGCAMVCHVSHCIYSYPLSAPCIPLLLHTIPITHLQNSSVSSPLPVTAHPLHTCYTLSNL